MRSDVIKKGAPAAPNRSLLYALGYTKEELERPLIGVVCSYNEIVPGHMNLDKIAEAVKAGIRAAGGTPVEFPAIAVCDGIAMGHVGMKYSLVTRDLIADSTEAMAMAHQFDGLVMIPNCDKNVPGLLMAAARVNIPTIFVSGGPMMGFAQYDLSVTMGKASNCVLCLSKEDMPAVSANPTCIRCARCVNVCPMHLTPLFMNMFAKARRWSEVEEYRIMDCMECGSCQYICPARIPLVQQFRTAKFAIRQQAAKK